MKLTTDVLKNSSPGLGQNRLELRDTGPGSEPGLIFRVTKTGKRSWSIRYRNNAGEQRRKAIGPYPAVSLKAARERARTIKGTISAGTDVVATERRTKADAAAKRLRTLDGLADAYWNDAALGHHKDGDNVRPKSPRTIADERAIYKNHIKPEFGSSSIDDIRRADVRSFIKRVSRNTPAIGRHCRNIMRQMLNYAVLEELLEYNPATNITAVKQRPRERVLDADELRSVWLACERPARVNDLTLSLEMGLAIMLVIATMRRSGEVIGARWSEFDFDSKTWLIPAERMKGRRTHVVPLNEMALEVLEAAQEVIGGGEWVFQSGRSSTDAPAPMSRWAMSKAMNRIVAQLGIPSATPHDLRRTGSTELGKAGVPHFTISRVLAHQTDTGGGAAVTGDYVVYDYLDEKRRALDLWSDRLRQVISGADNVTDIRVRASGRVEAGFIDDAV